MSVLSGMAPAEHGAIFNLRDVAKTETRNLISHELRDAGYRTVFALDERRFCHIDYRFGFDEIVGPDLGVLDFVAQSLNDTPLTNLALQVEPLSKLIRYSRHNVASVANYDSKGFVASVLAALAPGPQPYFAAVHFESAHYPYRSRHAGVGPHVALPSLERHVSALKVVDRQIGEMLVGLRERGLLDDALVILLSDHGESFGERMVVRGLAGEVRQLSTYGHGAFLLQPYESHVVLGAVRFMRGQAVGEGRSADGLVSLADVREWVQGFAQTGQIGTLRDRGCMIVETGVRFDAIADLTALDRDGLVTQAGPYYGISASGLMYLREERLGELIAKKDVAQLCADTFTLHDAKTDTMTTYQRTHDEAIELPLRQGDVLAIQAYRGRLNRHAPFARAVVNR